MAAFNTFIPERKERPLLLTFCLFFSLLLHVIIFFSLRHSRLNEVKPLDTKPEPTIVRLVDKPQEMKKIEYELDQKPVLPEQKPPAETTRQAERSQRVEKEQAPKGDDVADQAPAPPVVVTPPVPVAPPAPPAPPSTSKPPKPQTAEQAPKPVERGLFPPEPETGQATERVIPEPEPLPQNLPTLQQLTQLTPSTLNRLDRAGRERIKQRDDVEQGDTVWLNLEQGLLISFFRRFRNSIEGVWNYPPEAAQNGIEGLLLLKITVDRRGELLDVDLLRSSGFDLLDFEAIQAVYRAAPFGPLPSHYSHPDLKIHAHFRYRLTGKYIYGRP